MCKEKQDILLTLVLIMNTARCFIQMWQNDYHNCLLVSFYNSRTMQCNIPRLDSQSNSAFWLCYHFYLYCLVIGFSLWSISFVGSNVLFEEVSVFVFFLQEGQAVELHWNLGPTLLVILVGLGARGLVKMRSVPCTDYDLGVKVVVKGHQEWGYLL